MFTLLDGRGDGTLGRVTQWIAGGHALTTGDLNEDGRLDLVSDNDYLLHQEIISGEPARPTALDPAYPAALEALVLRALAKDRRARPPSALAVQEQLAELARTHHLDVSQFALGRYMSRVFGDELAAWHHAARAGQSLVEHVIRRTTHAAATVRRSPC